MGSFTAASDVAVMSPQILPPGSGGELFNIGKSCSLAGGPGVAPLDVVSAVAAVLFAVSTVFFIVSVATEPANTRLSWIVPGSVVSALALNLPFMSDVVGLRLPSIELASVVYHQSRSDAPL